ncbi:phage portal protein [Lysinibacillus fusiformis]|uniref:phage portal protein n=1 Tax=Lysinibacillus fusiformis TaxID=28031 RepID=UPI002E1ABA06|nr:phage portal protein [Lysinibacillus fusiformis]MED4888591.1 phage portal protein [Lysinibacillus fusiformis]
MLIEDLFRPKWHEQMEEVIKRMVESVIKNEQVLLNEIKDWENSSKRKLMLTGDKYYRNKMAIEEKERDADWKSNLKLIHGYVKKLVDQKVGYTLSKMPSVTSENTEYQKKLNDIFDAGMINRLRKVGKEAINKGVAYLHPYFNEVGELSFMRFPAEQIIPFYADFENMKIESFLRVYETNHYEGTTKKTLKKVEHYHGEGINYYVFEGSTLISDVIAGGEQGYHFLLGKQPVLWAKVPLIHFRYNEEEQPLIEQIKSLIDNYNTQASTNADLLADIPNFIYKLINYGGTDLKEFLNDLNDKRVVKLEEGGDLDKLSADIKTEANEKELDRTRRAIYELGRGVDTLHENLGNASGVALKFRYSDLDMDCNILESEMQSSIEHMMWFVTHYLDMVGQGDFTNEKVKFVFNRDIIINEAEAVEMCEKSVGIIDDQTNRENHPWYSPAVEKRLKEQKEEEQKEIDEYRDAIEKQRKFQSEVKDDE